MHVIGTAGHVDHGKSTLIERLTGIDPDRLAEEKQRGLTIDLGFAWITLPSGREAGIVDVPGHERFVHNMLAGAGSIDATIFVVAANEGWKPQSEEHLAILDLVGARGGVVALTKQDLVPEADLERVTADLESRLAGTVLASAAIVPVSPVTGDGIDDLIAAIDAMLERTPEAPDRSRPRLYADRSFTMKGSGTIVTGTLTGGRLRVEHEIEVLPAGARARIRSIQTHKRRRDEATPGSRVALNLAGLDRHEIRRGDAIVRPGQWRATDTMDVLIRPVRGLDQPVSGRGAFKVYLGSAEVDARLRFISPGPLEAGAEAYVRLRLAEPIVADPFDRFVLRDSGREQTVAGGIVLDAHPVRKSLTTAARAERSGQLEARRAAGRDGLSRTIVDERGFVPVADLAWLTGDAPTEGPVRGFVVSEDWLARATTALKRALDAYHAANPLAPGMPREEARAVTVPDQPRLFAALVESLATEVEVEGSLVRLATHRVTLSPEQQAARDRLVAELDAEGVQPQPLADLVRSHGKELVHALLDSGELIRFSTEYALTKDRYAETRSRIASAIQHEGPLTASRIRELLGTSRKYVIPLLEHFDSIGFTKRTGDVRILAL